LNTGTLGIGANGIHYLDLLYFLLNADSASFVAGEIDERVIPSGRGPQFGDFGGWAIIKFFNKGEFLANVFLSMSASSTVFGAWDIVGPHGRVYLSEVEGKRIDTLRKDDSQLPFNRYFGDYLPPNEILIESPFLGDLTRKWIQGVIDGEKLLPEIGDSIKVHELLFDWLGKSNTHKTIFPIT
jgi:predicted dehydrogenase